jgi:hypothetical protein
MNVIRLTFAVYAIKKLISIIITAPSVGGINQKMLGSINLIFIMILNVALRIQELTLTKYIK